MGRVTEALVAGSMLAGLATTACSHEYPTNFVDASDEQLVEETVEEAGNFWAAQGIGLGNGLQSEVVVGDETFDCGATEITSESMEMTYCVGSNTVAFSVGGINQIRLNGGTTALKAWVREAVGGLVQSQDPSLTQNAPKDEDQRDSYIRWQRACLAGIVTVNLHRDETTESFLTFLHTGDSRNEGHWLSRAYRHGYEARNKDRTISTDRKRCTDIPLPPDWLK